MAATWRDSTTQKQNRPSQQLYIFFPLKLEIKLINNNLHQFN